MKLFIGLIVSIINIWAITALIDNPIGISNWDNKFQRFNYPEDITVTWKSEGWGSTYFGPHGIIDLKKTDILNNKEKVFVWGDSFVEALQIDDKYKFHKILNQSFQKNDLNRFAINFGASGQSLPFYYFQIPEYEKIIGKPYRHYIIISSNDIEPLLISSNKENPHISIGDDIKFIKGNREPFSEIEMKVRYLIETLNLQFLKIFKNNLQLNKKLRFYPGPFKKNEDETDHLTNYSNDELQFIMEKIVAKMSNQTQNPITFIYLSPRFEVINGKVEMVNSKNIFINIFEEACARHNINFIDANEIIYNKFEKKKKLPIGFSNRYLLNGHLNKYGHSILAEIIYEDLTK